MLWMLGVPPAAALTLTLVSEEPPYDGVTLQTYRTADPATDTFVVRVDLCEPGVHVDATEAPSALQTAGAWGADVGAQVVVNGDFYRTGPVRVYGRAVSEGVAWPLEQTGADPAYSAEWYWNDYGWLAFGHDRVEFTHSGWVKNNAAAWAPVDGWALGDLGPAPPPGTLALVSGFPELVIEGVTYSCSSPTDTSCFPDRSDMRDRHPRTAMGIDAARETLILAVVDGRTTASAGMYGAELADLMGQLGAYEAFNLDGGGSSQLWLADGGYVNATSGNNSGGGTRAVGNHWGIFSDGSGDRPWHCESEPACDVLPAGGGILDDDSACFRTFGDPAFWREEAAGEGGHLFWTNAWRTDHAENWAWWQVHLEEGGEYDVQVYVDPAWGVFADARYEIAADGVVTEVFLDQGAASGWTSLGAFAFAAGGAQHVAVYDDAAGSVAADQHVVADALQLVRLDPYCGDGVCDEGEDCGSCAGDCDLGEELPDNGLDDDCDGLVDEGDPADTGGPSGDTGALGSGTSAVDTGPGGSVPDPGGTLPGAVPQEPSGCGCASASPSGWLAVLLGALAAGRRSREQRGRSAPTTLPLGWEAK
jgi:MYXO-CTERM domain-containing protein